MIPVWPVFAISVFVFLHLVMGPFSSKPEANRNELSMTRYDKNIRVTYSRLRQCVTALRVRGIKIPSANEIHEHYNEILELTNRYRGWKFHTTSGYSGPWIENHFIDTFIDKNISYFNGFVPLFVQWTDYNILTGYYGHKNFSSWKEMFQPLLDKLRLDMVYLVISQENKGLRTLNELFPNAIVLSAGGEGNIPIPLIKGDIKYIEHEDYTIDLSFYGSIDHGKSRVAMINELKSELKKKKYEKFRTIFTSSKQWIHNVSTTIFNLSPRGFGRASFRLSEIVQIGRIPVMIYDDFPWVPYDYPNSVYSAWKLGYIGRIGSLGKLLDELMQVSKEEVIQKLEYVKAARYLYTYKGVMEEIDYFIRESDTHNHTSRGSHLRCSPYQNNVNNKLSEMLDPNVHASVLRRN